ncbi:MAG TPA: YHYH protein [Phycisphaerales bacterium]|nr:YHYH protein [Phycisphaerales bacterium]
MIRATPLIIALIACCGLAVAHPPDEHGAHHTHATTPARTWTNSKTAEVIRGSFLASRDGNVTIERENGDLVTLAITDLSPADQTYVQQQIDHVRELNTPAPTLPAGAPPQAKPFLFFAPHVATRWDDRWLYVESDGLPHEPLAHPLMVGITSWQQQVPLPQPYKGDNAWRIPLKPVLADQPISGKTHLRRGAVALAANGVPIFNALNNRGDDAFLAGELDEFGGHSGRADDYHYHIAPLHLQRIIGDDLPIAYALDGFPIYGEFDPAAPKDAPHHCPLGATAPLDDLNGHFVSGNENYHYHASKTYPYINGGMRGVVTLDNDQIEPQPRTQGVRPALTPLRGALITGFQQLADGSWKLVYSLADGEGSVHYALTGAPPSTKYVFTFTQPDGTATTETYEPRNRGDDARPNRRERGAQGPAPQDGTPRQPWIVAHADEIDTDKDGVLTLAEVEKQAQIAFDAYDRDHDGSLARAEYDRDAGAKPARATMGGFIQLHASELDADSNGTLTRVEVMDTTRRMFRKSDADRDDKLTAAERAQPSGPAPADKQPADRPRRGDRANREDRPPRDDQRAPREDKPDQPGTLLNRLTEFKTDVPDHPFNIILVNPGATTMTVSVISNADAPLEGIIEYTVANDPSKVQRFAARTDAQQLKPATPTTFTLTNLNPSTRYAYRLSTRAASTTTAAAFTPRDARGFRTQAAPGTPFAFTIIADSHLDANVTPAAYERTLANARADHPDLHIDLGDTFMVDKRREYTLAQPQYAAQRYYFGLLCDTAPLLMVLGNHDGEAGYAMRGESNIASWSFAQRTTNFPPPRIDRDSIFTGRTSMNAQGGANYYTCVWGDARFIILDPFWFTMDRPRGGQRGPDADTANTDDNWSRTLGDEQYRWLTQTLETSTSRYTFVFIHHLVGGLGKSARGGVESSRFFEWGGQNADGSPGFAEHRPGWQLPIHDLFVKHHVSAVFHGHDHLYVHNQRDGIIYQCVPQPGNIAGGTRSATEYGYLAGDIAASPGHLRVRVAPTTATVNFIRSTVANPPDGNRRGNRDASEPNGEMVESYSIAPRGE